jgi:Ran GTPase-activating protein (RanGAP) involved in mRNA processing and transport
MSNCDLHDGSIQHLLDALSGNKTLQSLVLSSNNLTNKAMFKFRETFEEHRKMLHVRNIDLSSNHIEDEGGAAFI